MRNETFDRAAESLATPARLERIARDLAAVLSAQGEADWQRFLALAREVARRLDRQFGVVMDAETDSTPEAHASVHGKPGPRHRPSSEEI